MFGFLVCLFVFKIMASSIVFLPPKLPWSSPREAMCCAFCVLWSEAGLAKWTHRSIPAQSQLYARSCHGKAGNAEIMLEVLSVERVVHTVLSLSPWPFGKSWQRSSLWYNEVPRVKFLFGITHAALYSQWAGREKGLTVNNTECWSNHSLFQSLKTFF